MQSTELNTWINSIFFLYKSASLTNVKHLLSFSCLVQIYFIYSKYQWKKTRTNFSIWVKMQKPYQNRDFFQTPFLLQYLFKKSKILHIDSSHRGFTFFAKIFWISLFLVIFWIFWNYCKNAKITRNSEIQKIFAKNVKPWRLLSMCKILDFLNKYWRRKGVWKKSRFGKVFAFLPKSGSWMCIFSLYVIAM